MSLTKTLFVLTIGLGVLFVGMCLVPSRSDAQGEDHPAFPPGTLQQAPLDRHRPLLWAAGTAFAAVTYGLAGVCLLLGIRSSRRREVLPVFVAGALACVVAVMLVAILPQGVPGLLPAYFGGFPLPTALLLYLVPTAPLAFVLFYAIGFSRWVMTSEDERRFAELLKQRRSEDP